MPEKVHFPKITKGDPPDMILQSWRNLEVVMEEPLSREEMATAAAFTMLGFIIKCEPDDLQKTIAIGKNIFETAKAQKMKLPGLL